MGNTTTGQEYLYRWSGGRYPGERNITSAGQDRDIQGERGQDIVSIIQDQDIQRMEMPQPLNSNKKSFVALVPKM